MLRVRGVEDSHSLRVLCCCVTFQTSPKRSSLSKSITWLSLSTFFEQNGWKAGGEHRKLRCIGEHLKWICGVVDQWDFCRCSQYNTEWCTKPSTDDSYYNLIESKGYIMVRLSTRGECVVLGELIEDSPCLPRLWARWDYGLRMVHRARWGGTRSRDSLGEGLRFGSGSGLGVYNART